MKTAIEVGNAMIEAACHGRPLTEREARLLFGIAGLSDHPIEVEEERKPFGLQLLEQRLALHGLEVDSRVLLFITSICDRPGTLVLYAAMIKALEMETGTKVTWESFIYRGIPNGLPDDRSLEEIWRGQKVHDGKSPDNWLDRPEAWAA